MADVEELVVRAKPEGIDTTTGELGDLEDRFGDTADTLDETGDQMEGLASRWEGALTAIMTGLAVAVGGLLSQVPILGELMAGLGAVIEAVAFQIDQLLRPVLTPLTDLLFELSSAIFEAEGPLGDLIALFGLFTAVQVGGIGAIAGWIAATEGIGAVLSGIGTALSVAISGLTSFGSTLLSLITGSIAAAAALGALAGLVVVLALNTVGAFDMITNAGQELHSMFAGLVDFMLAFLAVGSLGLIPLLAAIGAAIVELVQGDVSGAVSAFQRVLGTFATGIVRTFQRVLSVIRQVAGAIGSVAGEVMEIPGVRAALQVAGAGTGAGGAGAGGGGTGGAGGGGTGGMPTIRNQLFIDGREAEKGTRKHRDKETNRRGRYG